MKKLKFYVKILKNISITRITYLVILGILIFFISGSYKNDIDIDKLTEPIPLENKIGNYYKINRQIPLIELEAFENMFYKSLQHIRYKNICFEDIGDYLISEDIPLDFTISVDYDGKSKNITHFDENNIELNFWGKQCFDISNKNSFSWTWHFYTNNTLLNNNAIFMNYPNSKDMPRFSNNSVALMGTEIKTYLVVSKIYIFFSFLLSMFYSGLILLASEGIWKFLNKK